MHEVFALTKPMWEIAVRATVVYFALVALARVIPKRRTGTISPNNILALIVIGGMVTDAVMGGSESATDILLMIALVVAWGYVLDRLEYRFRFFRHFLRDRESVLVHDGRLLRKNLRREMITEEDSWPSFARRASTIFRRSGRPAWRRMARSVWSRTAEDPESVVAGSPANGASRRPEASSQDLPRLLAGGGGMCRRRFVDH